MPCTCKYDNYCEKTEVLIYGCSRILDNLNGGIASSDRIDGLGKGVAEYLRSKYVDVPKAFLERGRI